MATSTISCEYRVYDRFEVDGDLNEAFSYGVKWGVLYIVWKEGEQAVEVLPVQSVEDDEDFNKRPINTELEVEIVEHCDKKRKF